jgi:hypothetical protein
VQIFQGSEGGEDYEQTRQAISDSGVSGGTETMKASDLKPKESDIQRGIKQLLQLHNFYVCKIQQSALSEKGIPDLWCIREDRIYGWVRTIQAWIEVKTATGRMSSEQLLFQESVTSRGGTFLLMRSIDDCIAWLRIEGIMRGDV